MAQGLYKNGRCVMEAQIGEAAGKVWQALKGKGAMMKPEIAKATGLSPDLLNMAIGWLAREGKLASGKGKSGTSLNLKT